MTDTLNNPYFKANDNLGVTVFLHGWAFQAEFPRSILSDVLADMDEAMTESGVPEDNAARVQIASISLDESIEVIEHTEEDQRGDAMHDLAFRIVYAFGKAFGMAKLIELRGLIGHLDEEFTLNFSPFADTDVYRRAAYAMREDYLASSDEDDDDISPPTIH